MELPPNGGSPSSLCGAGSWNSNQSAISRRDKGFHTVRSGVDRGELSFIARFVEVLEIWNELRTGDGTLSYPGRAGSYASPSTSAIGGRGWDFHTVRGGIIPGDILFRPRTVGVVDVVWKDCDPGMGPYRPRVVLTLCTSPGQTAIRQVAMFLFSSKINSTLKILDCQIPKYCRVLYLQEVGDLQQQSAAAISSITIASEELNDEGSDTVFRAWNTVRTSLRGQTTHRQTVCEARI